MLNYSMISVFLSLVTIPFAVWPNQLNFGLIIRISNPKPILSHETYLLGETYIKKIIIFLTLKKRLRKAFFWGIRKCTINYLEGKLICSTFLNHIDHHW